MATRPLCCQRLLADRISPRIQRPLHRVDTAARETDEYFAGRRNAD